MITNRFGILSTACLALGLAVAQSAVRAQATKPAEGAKAMDGTVLQFTMKTNDGVEKHLADYKGKVLLIVNTASECGYTPQYKGLEELYEKYKDKGFVILAFPANNFGGQEPGTDAQIKQFCSLKYNVTFPLFAKTSVKGADINPLYKFLTTQAGFDGDIKWNFNKFLVDRSGKVVARYDSGVTPSSETLVKEIEAYLK
jgi:glutathione peroxidase